MLRSGILLSCVLIVSGCSAWFPQFSTPIEWGDGHLSTYHPETGNVRVSAEVRLDPDGKAQLFNFPTGVSVTDDEGLVCFEPSSEANYTGPAEWSAVNGLRFALDFGESHVEISAGEARFGAQDWYDIRFQECGPDAVVWWFSLLCGDPGTGYPVDAVGCREN